MMYATTIILINNFTIPNNKKRSRTSHSIDNKQQQIIYETINFFYYITDISLPMLILACLLRLIFASSQGSDAKFLFN